MSREVKLVRARRYGDTTGLILEAIGGALRNPGEIYMATDPLEYETLLGIAMGIADKLNLNLQFINKGNNSIGIKSLHRISFEGSDGCLYEKVS